MLPAAIATVPVTASGEGGLLGIATQPTVASNRLFYLYYTTDTNGRAANRVERWRLSSGGGKAYETKSSSTTSQLPSITTVDGFALVQMGCSTGTGDARNPDTAQNVNSLSGKILRLTPRWAGS